MNNLQMRTATLDSREVAEMVGKDHSDLLKDVKRYNEFLAQGDFPSCDYFQESTYTDPNNRERPCFQITRKGCELIAHKMTGAKGTQFTAQYINRFHAMESHITSSFSLSAIEARLSTVFEDIASRKIDEIETKCSEYYKPSHADKLDVARYIKNRLGAEHTPLEYSLVKDRVLMILGGTKWEDIPFEVLRSSFRVIDESIRVIKLDRTSNQLSMFEM